MKPSRFVMLLMLLSIIFAGIMPAFAQVNTEPVAETLANIPQGWGIVAADALFTETLENPPFILDVRENTELEEVGFIPGAVHIPLRQMAANLDLLPANLDAPIVIYCKSGHRGAIGMTALQVLGYTNVRNLKGGINAWIDAGYEVGTGMVVNPEPGEMAPVDPALAAQVDDYLQNALPQGWGIVTVDNLITELVEAPPFLLDVREVQEWDEHGYIEGAINIPLRELGSNLDKLPDKATPIVVYCHSGHRGAIAMTALQMLGYDVRNLAGAITAWEAAGYPIVGGVHEEMAAVQLDMVALLDTYLQTGLPQGWGVVTADNLFTEILETPPFLLDVREASELEETGYIMGAVHIPLRQLASSLNLLPADPDAPIVIYCKSGHRGAVGMTALQTLGYTNVRNLLGGILAWTGAEYEVITDPYVEPEAHEAPDFDPELVAVVDDYLQNVLPQGWGAVTTDILATELLENPPFVIDVREVSEWEEIGHIEGAVNIPLRELIANLDKLPAKDTPIVLYCKSGHRAAIGMTALQMLGYDVRNLLGGINGWISAGYEVVGAAAAVEIVLPQGEILSSDVIEPIVLGYLAEVPQGFDSISVDTLMTQMGEVFLLDVREADEYNEGFIEGAVNIPVREVLQHLDMLPAKDAPIVVYCASGHRGVLATTALQLLGYDNVVNLRGGVRAYPADKLVTGPIPKVPAALFPEVDANIWATVNAYMSALPAGFSVIKVDDLNLMILDDTSPFLVDVRETSEYATGHLASAINIPTRSLGELLGNLPAKDLPVVMYDSSGQRSAMTMMALQLAGYQDVRSLGGGTATWEGAGYELITE